MNLLRFCASANSFIGHYAQRLVRRPFLNINNVIQDSMTTRAMSFLDFLHRRPPKKPKKCKNPLGRLVPMMKGVVLKTVVKKPKKPNSGNRKCVYVRLSNGKEAFAYIPGEGHNLQEHNVVMVRPGRTKDVPGLKLKCIRGKYDLNHVIKDHLK